MTRVRDLFEIKKGDHIAIARATESASPDAVPVVSRAGRNNGVVVRIERLADREPWPGGLLTVALGGSVLETFLQPVPFYTAHNDIAVLIPKREMSVPEKLWWASAIRANRYRYNYGRQANRTLADLVLPDAVPEWVPAAAGEAARSLARRLETLLPGLASTDGTR